MGSERRRWEWSPHLHLGLAFCNFRDFVGLNLEGKVLRSRNSPSQGPQFPVFASCPPLGSPSSLSIPISAPKSPESQAFTSQPLSSTSSSHAPPELEKRLGLCGPAKIPQLGTGSRNL